MRKLDVEYDDKAFGNLIDPYQWNANFKKIEEVFNENIDSLDETLTKIDDSSIPSAAISELDQTEDSTVRDQLLAIISVLLKKSDESTVEELIKNCIQLDKLTTSSVTLPPDSNVEVSHSTDDAGYLNLNFAIPRGKDGATIPLGNGVFGMKINDAGHLIIVHNDGATAPDMYIDENGHLIYGID